MKKLAALAALLAVATTASAQSTVTVFGIIDAAARNTKNGNQDVYTLATGGYNSSRLGFRGVEDLGGGLKANFWLEHGFNSDTGGLTDAARFWNRRATVALSSPFGEIRLGRDYTPTYWAFSEFDPFGDNGVGAGGKFNNLMGTNADTNTRSDNLVSYLLPSDIGGVYGQVSVAPGEGTRGKKYLGGRVGYRIAGFNGNIAYGQTDVSPLPNGGHWYKTLTAAVSYDFGVAKVSGYFDEKKYFDIKTYVANIGVSAPIGPVTVRGGYTKIDARGNLRNTPTISFNDANQYALGAVYALSKRTFLYTTVARVENKGNAAYAVSTPPAIAARNKSTGYEFGLRHAF
jgi:predicted porin